ncbi:hypothetical protein M422DRAFT_275926 [Sphaerobolus stellatus SS14]|uniref:Uncharacterized protein n=1 Tax=Sphaerobolus stellatus (strain SS14) TaxID=990650 RepID=A0A0C9UE87_SPHS4|nr:hypothetical protein M422DRAFT_275926 [Sphaerobolus stellatus SS14]
MYQPQSSRAQKDNNSYKSGGQHQATLAIVAEKPTVTIDDILLAISKRKHSTQNSKEHIFSDPSVMDNLDSVSQYESVPLIQQPPFPDLINNRSLNTGHFASFSPFTAGGNKTNVPTIDNPINAIHSLNSNLMKTDNNKSNTMGGVSGTNNQSCSTQENGYNDVPMHDSTAEGKRCKHNTPPLPKVTDEDIDEEVWKTFIHFKTLIRALAIERCKRNSSLNRRFFFYINFLAFHDFLHKQYLTEFDSLSSTQ